MKISFLSLSPNYYGEREGVRGYLTEIFISPLTAALRHPVFPNLYKAERDFILSPQGERNIVEAYFLSNFFKK